MNNAVRVTQDEIVVHAGHYIKHDGYIHRIGFLKHTLWQLQDSLATKNIRFILSDGEPIVYSSFETVIADVQKTYAIPPQRLLIEVIDSTPQYQNNLATVIVNPTRFFKLVDSEIPKSNWVLDSDSVLFGGIYGRFTAHRLLMSYFLETRLINNSFVIFQPGIDWVEFDLDPVKDYYADQLTWVQHRKEINKTAESDHNGIMNYRISLESYHTIWCKYKIEVIIETNVFDHGWFTEKTARCLKTGKPFVLVGTTGQLNKLQAMGFKTFNSVINEDYDNIFDLESRFNAIILELERINSLPATELDSMLIEIDAIAKYNAENYTTITNKYYQSFYVQSKI